MISDTVIHLDKICVDAGEAAHLPGPVIRGFDGDGWVWIWRRASEYAGEEIMIDTAVRARPDHDPLVMLVTISLHAWSAERPSFSAAYTIASKLSHTWELEKGNAQVWAAKWLHPGLITAKEYQKELLHSLMQGNQGRNELLQELREQGIFHDNLRQR
ncbi:MAG: hypothetical protein NTZ05_20325 [Chloroflexi bacterium]|nr:hypothetical protein [Chloroflexota bacterium]